jgi:hypothetical protein
MSNGLTLPFSRSFPSLSGEAFSIILQDGGGTAIVGEAYGTDLYGDVPSGVYGATDIGQGVYGEATGSGVGVYGTGGQYAGQFEGNVLVNSSSEGSDALLVTSGSNQHAAVSAQNDNGGYGVWATAEIPAGGSAPSSKPPVAGFFRSESGLAIQAIGNSAAYDAVYATTSSPGHAGVSANNTAPFSGNVPSGFGLWASSNNTAIYGQGQPAGYFEGDVQVTGDVILVNSSGDVAEDFDVEEGPAHAEPGTVLVIGSNGKLQASSDPYDTRVAGVVSGAGELKPAIVLQRIANSRPRCAIALVGKAFCKVDAEFGSIAPGDLLATSFTPGHAMKLSDYDRATGAILGKALAALKHGKGLIPILVTPR